MSGGDPLEPEPGRRTAGPGSHLAAVTSKSREHIEEEDVERALIASCHLPSYVGVLSVKMEKVRLRIKAG